MGSVTDAFGYREIVNFRPHAVEVFEAKDTDTLRPLIVLRVSIGDGTQRINFTLELDAAEKLAHELVGGCQLARENHWE